MTAAETNAKRIVVVGGGLTGLSAAFYLNRLAADSGLDVQVTLVEQSGRLGGRINTLERDGFVVERGPDSFLARKTPILDLTRELGIEDELVGQGAKGKRSYILRDGVLHPMPAGMVLAIPTNMEAFMETGLISDEGKRRALEDLTMPKREQPEDESLGHFLERRLGKELLDHLAEPLLAGIYAGDTYALSLQATFPQFQESEQKFGSLIKGSQESQKTSKPPIGVPEQAQGSVFLSYRRGLSTLVRALEEAISDMDIRLNCGIREIRSGAAGPAVELANGETLEADAVIVTLPVDRLPGVIHGLPAVERLGAITYISVANVVLAYDQSAVDISFDGSGFVIPRSEGRFITACTWTSAKWPHTAPEGKMLVRCYVGRAGAEDWVDLTDDEIAARVRHDVRELMGIDAEPLFTEITRLYKSMPQYPVGHLERIREARAELDERLPGVFATGGGFHGVGLPDCIRQAKETAEACLSRLSGDAAVRESSS